MSDAGGGGGIAALMQKFGGGGGHPLTPSRASLYINPEFEHAGLSERQLYFDERIRTASMVVIAIGVIYAGMYFLHAVLIPFFLALALRYLLVPLIDFISCRGQRATCLCRCPRPIAVLLSFVIAILLILALGLLIVRSITAFTSHTEKYEARIEALVSAAFEWVADMQDTFEPGPHVNKNRLEGNLQDVKDAAVNFMQNISLTSLILSVLGTAAHIAENALYVVLFLVFMLAHAPSEDAPIDAFTKAIDRQIFVYIRGKGFISLFVALFHAAFLASIGLDLFLAFGVLSFFLNFIPNVGMFSSILLPMPLVALDPDFEEWQVILAFVGPLTTGTFAKDVLEPLILGGATQLHPVAVLLAIMLFGSVWGVTGMVMAVPMTAVFRIYLAAVDHPLSKYMSEVIGGTSGHEDAKPPPLPTSSAVVSPGSAPATGSTVASPRDIHGGGGGGGGHHFGHHHYGLHGVAAAAAPESRLPAPPAGRLTSAKYLPAVHRPTSEEGSSNSAGGIGAAALV